MSRYRVTVEVGSTVTMILEARTIAEAEETALDKLQRYDDIELIDVQEINLRPDQPKHSRYKPYQ
jgi:hypothetical protein